MRPWLGKTAYLGLSLIVTGNVFALGLGNVSGQPTLGQPLSIEIPLLGSDNRTPSVECFKIRHPMAEIESTFVLRDAQIQLIGERGQAKLVVTTAAPVHEPVIEFGIAVGCGFELSRDYLLLTSEPAKTTATAPVWPTIPPILTPAESPHGLEKLPKQQKPGLPVAPSNQFLRIEKDVTLKILAQKNYPLQPKAREKYMRMMAQANPHLQQNEDPIIAGSELLIPPGLPLRRMGAYSPVSKVASIYPGASLPNVPSPPPSATRKPAAPKQSNQDLLVLGAPAQRHPIELLAEAERLTALLLEQVNAQSAASEKITELEDTLTTLKKHVSGLENRINTIEVERQAEKLAAKPASLDFFELLLAVLVGGAIGGLTLHLYNRMQLRRNQGAIFAARMPTHADDIPAAPSDTPKPIKIVHGNDFDFVSKPSP